MQRLATVISAVFHPLLMPLLCVAVAGEYDWYVRGTMPREQLQLTYLVIALSTIAFPGLNILLLRWYGAISNLEVTNREERLVPYLSSAFFIILGYVLLRRGGLPAPIYAILMGCILSLLLLMLFNLKYKVSAHAAGCAGLLGATLGLFRIHGWSDLMLLVAIILICGLVLSARLVLNVHNPREVYAGALLGFGSVYLCVSQLWVI